MDPLELLPPEIWTKIFEKVKEAQDWLNLYRASPSFEAVVGDELPAALFPQVFPLVQQQHLNKDTDINDLLRLRLVSRQWKETVDKTLTLDPLDDNMSSRCEDKYWFRDAESISKFLKLFGTHSGSPFIGNYVYFLVDGDDDTPEEETAEFRDLVVRFLGRFGDHVRKMRFEDANETDTSLDNFLIALRTCLQLVPKLEALTVEFQGTDGVDYGLEDPRLGNPPFPTISGLKSFRFEGYNECSSSVDLQNIIIRMSCNPDTLKKATDVDGVPSELTSFPNLEIAKLTVDGTNEELSRLATTSWPLSRLSISFRGVSSPPLDYVIKCAELFKDTLTSLEVDPWKASDQDCLLKLNLPHLKYLKVDLTDVPFGLLTNLSNLEELHVGSHQSFQEQNDVLEYIDSMERDMLVGL